MDSEHEAVEPAALAEVADPVSTIESKPQYNVRRKSLPWDRVRFIVLLSTILLIIFWTKYNAPFTTAGDAFREMTRETYPRIFLILLPFEIVRQLHYLWSEKSEAYHRLWADRIFGGAENQMRKYFSSWTRFRLGRYIRLAVYLLIYGTIVTVFAGDISSPIEAIVRTPEIVSNAISQIAIFLFYMLLVVGQFGALFWFLSRGGVDTVMPEEIETRYTNVWGQDHVLELVRENVGFLEKPEEIEEKGGYIPGGILLWGPPGTGKTLIAEATAGEVGVPFVFVDPGAFINMFFGVGILKVKGLFRKLRKLSLRHGGVVAFFDEADSLGSRGSLAQEGPPGQPSRRADLYSTCNGANFLSHGALEMLDNRPATEEPQGKGRLIDRVIMGGMGGGGGGMGTLQALLTEISGLTKPRGISNKIRKALGMRPKLPPKYRIFIMMASNMPQTLDPALLRPGRIDRIYKVGYPATEGRVATIRGYLAKVDHELTDDHVQELAVKTPYYSGAKIKDLINEALIHAMRDDREIITWDDIWHAKRLKELGPAEGFEYVDREEFAVAVHEAGHAVAAHLLRPRMAIDIATIERRGETGGMVSSIPMEDRFVSWKSELENDVKVALASLAAERMFFEGDNSMGVGGDLQKSTALVSAMIGVYAMGDTIASAAGMPRHLLDQPPDPTDEIKRTQSVQVEARMSELYEDVYSLLTEYREHVLAVALRLQEVKTISGTEVAEIIGTDVGAVAMANPKGFSAVDLDETRQRQGDVTPNGESAAGDMAGDGAAGESGNGHREPEVADRSEPADD